eukprot:767141-Hanusia_phi.AAC.3
MDQAGVQAPLPPSFRAVMSNFPVCSPCQPRIAAALQGLTKLLFPGNDAAEKHLNSSLHPDVRHRSAGKSSLLLLLPPLYLLLFSLSASLPIT